MFLEPVFGALDSGRDRDASAPMVHEREREEHPKRHHSL